MVTEITYKPPYSKGKVIATVKPFKLEPVPRCYCCGNELKTEEKQQKSTFKYYDTDGTIVGTVEAYVCFDCIEKITGRRPDHE